MYSRRHGSKPTLALWMLVAVADMGILLGAAGPLAAVLIGAAIVLVAAAVMAARLVHRRDEIASLVLLAQRAAKPRTMANLLTLTHQAAPRMMARRRA